MQSTYLYKAKVISVYDGDTITVEIDLGFSIRYYKMKLRLYGIDAPEMRGPNRENGKISRDWLRGQIQDKNIIVKTIKDKKGKYGRYLCLIYLDDININELMVSQGYAKFKIY